MPASIALVDDDRNILTSVSIALQAEGFLTRVYPDGEAALKALIENPPDLAVLDIKMPRMDGMELLSRLRQRTTDARLRHLKRGPHAHAMHPALPTVQPCAQHQACLRAATAGRKHHCIGRRAQALHLLQYFIKGHYITQ